MARATEPDQAHYSSGFYAWLVDREERAAARPGVALPWTPEQPSYDGYPDRLAALRAGCAVNLPVSDLPKHARVGMDNHVWNRATVSPDSSITLSIDHGEWLVENGI
jgi:hypothetical protein